MPKRHSETLAGAGLHARPLVIVAQEVAGDAVEPRQGRAVGLVAEPPQREGRPREGLGGELARVLPRRAGPQERIDRTGMAAVELGEGAGVAAGRGDQLRIGLHRLRLIGLAALVFHESRETFSPTVVLPK